MKILVVGGTGHAGTYLVPKLLSEGHEVYVAARGKTGIRLPESFEGVKYITVDAKSCEDFSLLKEYAFDTVVDFTGTAYKIWQALRGSISHLVACGSLWMFGNPKKVPTPEITQDKVPFEVYARRYAEILKMQEESGKEKTVFTAIMPPNFAGPGKIPLDPMGDRSIENQRKLKCGCEIVLPEGPEALIGPCDASDIASLFDLAINNKEASAGEIFNVGSEYALTASEFVRLYARIYGSEISIRRVSWETYVNEISPSIGDWWHFYAHMCPDISKAKAKLGYKPRFTPEEAIERAVRWMEDEGML